MNRGWRFWLTLVVVAVLLILATKSSGYVQDYIRAREQARDLDAYLTSLEQEADSMVNRLAEAKRVYEDRHLEFADHWSEGLEEELHEAEIVLSPYGEIFTLLRESRNQGDQLGSRKLDEIRVLLESILVIDTILGPPESEGQGFYDQLARNAAKALDRLEEARKVVNETRVKLQSDPKFISTNAFKYAEDSLHDAEQAATTKVERGIIDLPLTYSSANLVILGLQGGRIGGPTITEAQLEIEEARSTLLSNGNCVVSTQNQEAFLMTQLNAESLLQIAEKAFSKGLIYKSWDYAQRASDQSYRARQFASCP